MSHYACLIYKKKKKKREGLGRLADPCYLGLLQGLPVLLCVCYYWYKSYNVYTVIATETKDVNRYPQEPARAPGQ